MSNLRIDDDFEYLISFLPDEWQSKAKELGALKRCRKIRNAETLLRVLLIHLAEGCSLRETSVRVSSGGLANLSDVAIMDRLRLSGEWFRWINQGLMEKWITQNPSIVYGDQWRLRLVDGTRIKEPGPTGSSWCVHYSVELPSLHCDELTVLNKHGNGETFKRFQVYPGDLLIGDRVYASPPSISHVLESGGDVLVRFGWNNLPLWLTETERFDLFDNLRQLKGGEVGDWEVKIMHGKTFYSGRVCALKKSRQAAEKARIKAKRSAQKHGSKIKPETLEAAGYIFVFTSASSHKITPNKVLEMYRGRWQIELVFKRLKSLIGFGHLRKRDPVAAKSWIHGKLMVAFLIEALITQGEALFPWGYPVREAP